MIKRGFKSDDIDAIRTTLRSHHTVQIKVQLLDLDHNYIDDLSNMFTGGQVNYDADADITRSLDLTLFDPLHKAHLDKDSPHKGSVYLDNMIKIMYVIIRASDLKAWEVPVFCGPIDDVNRDDVYLSVKCLGKETLSVGNLWKGRNFKKGQEKTTVISTILKDLCGESKLNIPSLPKKKGNKLPNVMKLNSEDAPWKVCKKLASSMGYQLFYDGMGVAQMRKVPSGVCWTFNQDSIVTVPKIDYDLSQTINAVKLTGRKSGKKKKHVVKARRVAPGSHPLSPRSLGRKKPNGDKVPRFLWKSINDTSIRNNKEAKARCEKELAKGLRGGVSVTFDGLHMPLLEESDVCRINWEGHPTEFHLRQWTLPLTVDSMAAYGYLKRTKYNKKRSRK